MVPNSRIALFAFSRDHWAARARAEETSRCPLSANCLVPAAFGPDKADAVTVTRVF